MDLGKKFGKEILVRGGGQEHVILLMLGCSNDASVGAQVGINKIQRKYILPMCVACSFKEDVIKVKKKSFTAPIFKRDIDMMLK